MKYELEGLVRAYKAGEQVDEERMVKEARKLAGYVLYKYYYNLIPYVEDISDSQSFMDFSFAKSLHTYKSEIGAKFTTYYIRVFVNDILMNKRKLDRYFMYSSAQYRMRSLNEKAYDDEDSGSETLETVIPDTSNDFTTLEIKMAMKDYVNGLSEKDRVILRLLYEGHKQNTIAEKVGVSQAYVSRVSSRMRKEIIQNILR